jgi:chemotaxis protein MotB
MSGPAHGTDEDEGPPHHEEHPAHDEEPWLVSYADMMTLLFGFFVLMYVFTLAKLEKAPKESPDDMIFLRKELANYFGGEYVTPLKDAQEQFIRAMGGEDKAKDVNVSVTPEGLDITVQSNAVFKSGSAEIEPGVRNALRALAKETLAEKQSYRVVVEGHTDDVPIVRNTDRFPTNWELSSARATAVVRIFEEAGYEPMKLMAIGYGSSRPKFPNREADGRPIPENQAKNRRIRLKLAVLSDPTNPDSDKAFPPEIDGSKARNLETPPPAAHEKSVEDVPEAGGNDHP